MDIVARFVTPGIVFLLTLASGFWLSRRGKPLKTGIFTLHKLIALAAAVVTALQIFDALKIVEVQPILIALLSVIGFCVVALFATGALMSANRPGDRSLLTIHRIAPLLAVVAGVLVIYLLSGRSR
jgi:hypothetical protein